MELDTTLSLEKDVTNYISNIDGRRAGDKQIIGVNTQILHLNTQY